MHKPYRTVYPRWWLGLNGRILKTIFSYEMKILGRRRQLKKLTDCGNHRHGLITTTDIIISVQIFLFRADTHKVKSSGEAPLITRFMRNGFDNDGLEHTIVLHCHVVLGAKAAAELINQMSLFDLVIGLKSVEDCGPYQKVCESADDKG